MKTEIRKHYFITAKEGKHYLTLEFSGEKTVSFDSNLPYRKKIEDWEFYGKAIRAILKEYRNRKEQM